MDPIIIYEDENILAVNKPAGMLTHSSAPLTTSRVRPGSMEYTLADWACEHDPGIRRVGEDSGRPGIVHRLDRETSGIILIAKNQRTFLFLKRLFQERTIIKSYVAIVHGKMPKAGRITKPIGIKNGSVKRSVFSSRNKKEAYTRYETEAYGIDEETKENYSLVRAYPETGRTHQIRVHFASIGHPIVGDVLYGAVKNKSEKRRHLLHAESITFTTEDGSALTLSAEPPEDFSLFFSRLKREAILKQEK